RGGKPNRTLASTEIQFVLLVNRQGKDRLTKWYSPNAQKERSKDESLVRLIGKSRRFTPPPLPNRHRLFRLASNQSSKSDPCNLTSAVNDQPQVKHCQVASPKEEENGDNPGLVDCPVCGKRVQSQDYTDNAHLARSDDVAHRLVAPTDGFVWFPFQDVSLEDVEVNDSIYLIVVLVYLSPV
ncbi:hypothetical protein V2J09_016223, partial [Rumex salicifolius]